MKKVFRKLLAVLLSSTVALSFAGCGTPEVEDEEEPLEQIDPFKTQLYINNYGGGYSSAWLRAAKERFEDLHKDDEWEDGKKGVQIYVTSPKSAVTSAGIRNNRDEVYFSEYAYYRSLKADGVLLDITDAVKADLHDYGDAAGKTIESKLTPQQREFFGISENGSAHYYGLPHYAGYTGITYNVDLFDEKGYYFVDGYETKTKKFLFYYNNAEKSVGPDGEKGTADDGLPETYDDFFILLQQMQSDGVVPISWNGTHNASYLNYFLQSLVADYEGLDQMMLNYTFDGPATDLGAIKDGEFVNDETPTQIDATHGYEVYRQQGKYEALEFLRKLVVKSNDDYHHELAFNGGYSHMDAQRDYLYADIDGVTAPIGMLIDGIWWQSEATATFNTMAKQYGEEYAKENRNFAFMPLPKATREKANVNKTNGKDAKKLTLYDHIYSMCFVKGNIAEWKKPLALDFLKFVHTDESLIEFTIVTNAPKAFTYELNDEQLAELSPFGRSVIELQKKADIVYPFSTSPLYVNRQSQFVTGASYRYDERNQYPATYLREHDVTAADYFTKMCSYYKNLNIWENN